MHRFSLLKATRVTRLCSVWASHCGGFSCCGARAPGVWALVVEAHGLESCGAREKYFFHEVVTETIWNSLRKPPTTLSGDEENLNK